MNSRPLTLATLRKKGACHGQLTLFRELFGNRVDVTEALASEYAGKFNVAWAALLLSPPAQAAYEAAEAQAWDAYNAATAEARTAYNAAKAQARARAYISDGGEK